MNIWAPTIRLRRSIITGAILFLAALPAFAADIYLVAKPFTKTMPDGIKVPMWGFAPTEAGFANVAPPTVPGPMIAVPKGDTTLNIHLRNELPGVPVSIVIPGLPAPLTPVRTPPDPKGNTRVTSFTAETPPDGITEKVYSWSGLNLQPGTYAYHSGTHPAVQVPMGLYGGVTIDASEQEAYPGIFYDNEVILFYSEIDPALNEAVTNGTYGTPTYPSPIGYLPTYSLLNGASYPAAHPRMDHPLQPGEQVLLRFLNMGLKTHAPALQGPYLHLVAEDGNPYSFSREQYSLLLPAGKTKDALWTPSSTGRYALYDRRLALTNQGRAPGGMLSYLKVMSTAGFSFVSIAAEDGWVRESSENSNLGGRVNTTGAGSQAIRIGDNSSNKQYKSILSFDTSSLPPGAWIISATLRLTAGGGWGSNPLLTHGPCTVDIRKGGFSGSPALEKTDFEAPADATEVATITDQGGKYTTYTVPLGPAALPQINQGGRTQLRLACSLDDNNDSGSDYASFYPGDTRTVARRPQLMLQYALNNLPSAANNTYIVEEGEVLTVSAPGVLGNDSDGDGDPMTVHPIQGPASGLLDLHPDGSFTYTPDSGTLSDSFIYQANDGYQSSNPATVTINVHVIPVLTTIQVTPNPVTISVGNVQQFQANGIDQNGNPFPITPVWTATVGTITSSGLYTAGATPGPDTVTATAGAISGAATLNVTDTPPTEISFVSIGKEDGWVRETTETSDVGGSMYQASRWAAALRIGDYWSDRQFKSILSFDTSSIPAGTTILSATLELTRGRTYGTNPFETHGTAFLDIKRGGFSGSNALQRSDFEAPADAEQVAVITNQGGNKTRYFVALDTAALGYINPAGRTQLRMYFSLDDNDDFRADYAGFYSGENHDPARRPILKVIFQGP